MMCGRLGARVVDPKLSNLFTSDRRQVWTQHVDVFNRILFADTLCACALRGAATAHFYVDVVTTHSLLLDR